MLLVHIWTCERALKRGGAEREQLYRCWWFGHICTLHTSWPQQHTHNNLCFSFLADIVLSPVAVAAILKVCLCLQVARGSSQWRNYFSLCSAFIQMIFPPVGCPFMSLSEQDVPGTSLGGGVISLLPGLSLLKLKCFFTGEAQSHVTDQRSEVRTDHCCSDGTNLTFLFHITSVFKTSLSLVLDQLILCSRALTIQN